jgi:hypothetical protein
MIGLGDATGAVTPEENNDTMTVGDEPVAAGTDPNGALTLPWYQSLYQSVLQATGQATGQNFFTSPLGIVLIGGAVIGVGYLLLESPVLAAVLTPRKNPVKKRRRKRSKRGRR